MEIVTVRVPAKMHEEMKANKDINWSEEIRHAIHERLKREKMKKACETQDRLRAKTTGKWSGAKEIRKWRRQRK
jgi:hypothetical protein